MLDLARLERHGEAARYRRGRDRRALFRREEDGAAVEDGLTGLDVLLGRLGRIGRMADDLHIIRARRDDGRGAAHEPADELYPLLIRQDAHRGLAIEGERSAG